MALTDRKMPIITDVNDTPSVEGDPSHPNGSLMCSQFNALIDNELTTIQTAVGTIPTTTDDLTEGATNKYYATALANTDFDTRLATKTTDDLPEGTTNKYFSNTLARTAVSATVGTSGITYDNTTGVFDFSNVQAGISDLNSFTTDDLVEGTTNKYYDNSLFNTSLATKTTDDLTEGITNKYYSTTSVNTDFDTRLATKTTDDLTEGTTNKYFADSLARLAISVTGNGSYDNATGVINISNATVSVDHISLTSTIGLTKTYTIYADSAETIIIGSFNVSNGANGQDGINGTNGVDGRSIEKVTSFDNGNSTKTLTFWGDLAETINLGSVILASGVDGVDGVDGIDGKGITNTSYNASNGTVTFTFSDATTFTTGDLRGANGTNGTNGVDGVSPTVTVLTQAQYTALSPNYNANTFYVING